MLKQIDDPDDLLEEINRTPVRKTGSQRSWNSSASNMKKQALEDKRRAMKFFELAANGSGRDIEQMKCELKADPRKYMFDRSDPSHLINKRNVASQTPLYIACMHGNIEMVKFLIQEEANPHVLSKISSTE